MRKVFLLAFALFAWNILANAQESDERYIEVTGSSEIEVVPDEIHFLIQIKEYWEEEMFWDQYWKLSHISDQAHTCIADSEIWMITKRHDCNGEDDDEYLEELDRINRRRKEELYRLEAEANKHIEKIKRMNKESGELFNSIKNDLYNIKEKKDD